MQFNWASCAIIAIILVAVFAGNDIARNNEPQGLLEFIFVAISGSAITLLNARRDYLFDKAAELLAEEEE